MTPSKMKEEEFKGLQIVTFFHNESRGALYKIKVDATIKVHDDSTMMITARWLTLQNGL